MRGECSRRARGSIRFGRDAGEEHAVHHRADRGTNKCSGQGSLALLPIVAGESLAYSKRLSWSGPPRYAPFVTIGTRIAVTMAAVLTTVPLAGCGGSNDTRMSATLTDDGCTYRGDNTAAAGRFTIEVEDQTGHGRHFVLKELADGFSADSIEPILAFPTPEIRSLFKEDPVFLSNVNGDASGVLLADVPAGTYVLMCRGIDASGLHLAALIEVTGTRSYP
jgi:hypothetical protein